MATIELDAETEDLAKRYAAITGLTVEAAVKKALYDRPELSVPFYSDGPLRLGPSEAIPESSDNVDEPSRMSDAERKSLQRDIAEISRYFIAAWGDDTRTLEEILGYDEYGLPN